MPQEKYFLRPGADSSIRDKPPIPDHTLLRVFAVGTYGEVWLAVSQMGSFRAIKVTRRDSFTRETPYEREFAGLRRYEPISREHDGLVDVLQVGRDDDEGFFYSVMELADDAGTSKGKPTSAGYSSDAESPTVFDPESYRPHTLTAEIARRRRLPVNEVINLGVELVGALQFLHSRGLVHRDIKPDNIIFSKGQPKLVDFGLLADIEGARTYVGTEGYIPPEGPGKAQADIFSMGKVLYQAATGFLASDYPNLPTLATGAAENLPFFELNCVLQRACEDDLKRRYQTADAMLVDLKILASGRSLRERQITRKRRSLYAGATVVVAGCTLLTVVAWLLGASMKSDHIAYQDEFDRTENRSNWSASHSESGADAPERRSYKVAQENGGMLISAQTRQSDVSVLQAAYADLAAIDLSEFKSCRVEVKLSGSSQGGLIGLTLSDSQPYDFQDPGIRLVQCSTSDTPLIRSNLSATVFTADFFAEGEAVVVYPPDNIEGLPEAFDIANLTKWHLRFFAEAGSSGYRPAGFAELRVHRLTIRTNVLSDFVLGRVREELSDRPIEGATITDRRGKVLGTSASSGLFRIPRAQATTRLLVEKSGFKSVDAMGINTLRNPGFINVRLAKVRQEHGDPMHSVPFPPRQDVICIGARRGVLHGMVKNGSQVTLQRPNPDFTAFEPDANARSWSFLLTNSPCSFSEVNERLMAVSRWRGYLWDLEGPEPVLISKLTHTELKKDFEWPNGAAFDGKLLWTMNRDPERGWHYLVGVYPADGRILQCVTNTDAQGRGLAWDGQRFWIASRDMVYAADRDRSIKSGKVAKIAGLEFPGDYVDLAYAQSYLWGLDISRRRVCQIYLQRGNGRD